jgi:hypothetical protein
VIRTRIAQKTEMIKGTEIENVTRIEGIGTKIAVTKTVTRRRNVDVIGKKDEAKTRSVAKRENVVVMDIHIKGRKAEKRIKNIALNPEEWNLN